MRFNVSSSANYVSKAPGEAIVQIKALFPRHAHRIHLQSEDMGRWAWNEVYNFAPWKDITTFSSIFIKKMIRRFNKYPTKRLYLLSPEIDGYEPDQVRNFLYGANSHRWCLYFMPPMGFQMKMNTLIVRQIHDE